MLITFLLLLLLLLLFRITISENTPLLKQTLFVWKFHGLAEWCCLYCKIRLSVLYLQLFVKSNLIWIPGSNFPTFFLKRTVVSQSNLYFPQTVATFLHWLSCDITVSKLSYFLKSKKKKLLLSFKMNLKLFAIPLFMFISTRHLICS